MFAKAESSRHPRATGEILSQRERVYGQYSKKY